MSDVMLYCFMGLIALLIIYYIVRSQSFSGGNNYSERGNEIPRYDDPDIQGRGSFGRDNSPSSRETPRNNSGPRIDSRRISGRGSFGRNKR